MSRSKRILRFFDVFWTLSNNWTQTNFNGNVAMTNWPPTESHPVTANRAVSRLLFSNIKLQTTLDSISFDFSASTLQNYAHRSGIRFDKVLSCANHCTWLVYVRGLLNFREERQRKPLPCHWKIGTNPIFLQSLFRILRSDQFVELNAIPFRNIYFSEYRIHKSGDENSVANLSNWNSMPHDSTITTQTSANIRCTLFIDKSKIS